MLSSNTYNTWIFQPARHPSPLGSRRPSTGFGNLKRLFLSVPPVAPFRHPLLALGFGRGVPIMEFGLMQGEDPERLHSGHSHKALVVRDHADQDWDHRLVANVARTESGRLADGRILVLV